MKRLLIMMALSMILMTGCQDKEQGEISAEEQAVTKEETTAALEEVLSDYIIQPNDALKMVFSKSWDVTGTEDVYVLEMDGTGKKNEEPLTYACGFDGENNIVLELQMESESIAYVAVSDATGYGLDLTPVNEGTALNLFPSDMTLLDMSDEKVTGLFGEWKDASGNGYEFAEDGTLMIRGKESDTPGTWCAIEKENGRVIVNLLVTGGSLEFEYEIQEEGKTLALYNRGAETWYYWTRS